MKIGRLFLTLLFLISLPVAFSATVENGKVWETDGTLYTHAVPWMAGSPSGISEQTFRVENVSGSDLQDLWIGFAFDTPLISQKIWRIVPASYDWVEYSKTCGYDFNYVQNRFPEDRNPDWGECWIEDDSNGDITYVFQHKFKYGNAPTKTGYYDVWKMIQGETRIEDTQNWDYIGYVSKYNKYGYARDSTFDLANGQIRDSVVEYETGENSGNWLELIWQGSRNCLLTDSCSYDYNMDPWYNNSWGQMNWIFIDSDRLSATVDENHAILVNLLGTWDGWAEIDANGNDVRFTLDDNVTDLNHFQLDFNFVEQDANFIVTIPENFNKDANIQIALWYENATAVSTSQANGFPSSYQAFFLNENVGTYVINYANTDLNALPTSMSNSDLNADGKGKPSKYSLNFDGVNDLLSADGGDLNVGDAHSLIFWTSIQDLAGAGSILGLDFDGGNYNDNMYYTGNDLQAWSNSTPAAGSFHWDTVNNWLNDYDFHQVIYTHTFDSNVDTNFYTNGIRSPGQTCGNPDCEDKRAQTTNLTQGKTVLGNIKTSLTWVRRLDYIVTPEEVELLYASESKATNFITFGPQESNPSFFTTSFIASIPSPTGLDPELGINGLTVVFTDTTAYGAFDWNNSTWFRDDVIVGYDQNVTIDFNNPGDFNIFVIIENTNDSNQSAQMDYNVGVYPQDINFFWTPATQGIDLNFDFNSSTNEDNNITNWFWGFAEDGNFPSITDQNAFHAFTSSGLKYVCLTVYDALDDLNKTVCAFVPVTGQLNVQFYDEDNAGFIVPTTATFNGVDVTGSINATGLLTLNIGGINAVASLIASDINHSPRTWTWDVNNFSNIDINGALLHDDNGESIAFLFKNSAGVALANAFVTVFVDDINVAGRTKLSVLGETTFYLNPIDRNYFFLIEPASGSSFIYNLGIARVQIPLDLSTLANVNPYDIVITQIGPRSFSALNAIRDVNIFTNTKNNYLYSIDCGASYFPTAQLIKIEDDDTIYNYQPYCLLDDGNSVEVTVYTIDNQNNRASLPGVEIFSFTTIGFIDTLAESQITDGTGQTLMHFEIGREYTLFFYLDGELLLSTTFVPSASSANLFAYLETGDFAEADPLGFVQVEWYSNSNYIPVDGNIELQQLLMPFSAFIGDVNVWITQNGVLLYNAVISVDSNEPYTLVYDVNVSTWNEYIPIIVNIEIFSPGGASLYTGFALYSIIATEVWNDTIENLSGFGTLFLTIFMCLMGIIVVGKIAEARVGQDNSYLWVISGFFPGVLVIWGGLDFVTFVFAVVFSASIAMWRSKD